MRYENNTFFILLKIDTKLTTVCIYATRAKIVTDLLLINVYTFYEL